jgi:hypothetical protein
MSAFYHGGANAGQHVPPSTWLFVAYCHARTAGLPQCTVPDFCRRYLSLAPLGPKLTTEGVIRTLILPAPEDRN